MTIVHGDNQIASRQFFISLKDQAHHAGRQVVDLPGESVTLEQLTTASESASLLGTTNAVFVEGFFTRRPSADKKAVIVYLAAHSQSDISLWDGKDVTAQIKGFPVSQVKKFDLPHSLWQFLDTFSVDAFHRSLISADPEQILALLAIRLHQLIMVKDGHPPPSLAPWQVGKLNLQAAKYSPSSLIAMHASLLDLDYQQKTSTSAIDLAGALEVWLVKNVQ